MKRTIWAGAVFFLTAFGSLGASPASAQTALFTDGSELEFVLEGPLGELVRASTRSTDPRPAIVTLAGRRYDIELAPRGLSRRTHGICTFPPLRLDFQSAQVRGTPMRGQNRLKLVTRCRSGSLYEQLTVLEYTAYRLYNEITPFSFRVRPARVTYRDTSGRRDEETQFNFLVEDVGDLARRNGRRVALEVQSGEVRSTQLHPDTAARVGLFQYMIGNLDWDMVQGPEGEDCCHNGKLLAATATSREGVIPAPYDFDMSGFVNPPYGVVPDGINIANLRVRYYRGLCRYNDQARMAAEHFRSRRDALYGVIDGETRLSQARRRIARRYIEGFFEILDDPERFESQIIERCRH